MTSPPADLAVDEWTHVLDAYRAELDRIRRLLDDDVEPERLIRHMEQASAWPPDHLPSGTMPMAVSRRAQELLAESHELIDAIAARLVGRRSPRSRRSRPASRSVGGPSRWSTTL